MTELRKTCTGLAPVHLFGRIGGVAAAVMLAAMPLSAADAQVRPTSAKVAAADPAPGDAVAQFYRARGGQLLWLTPSAGTATQQLFMMLSNASVDGLDPQRYGVDALRNALQAASRGDRRAILHADQMLSRAFVDYVRDLRRDPGLGIIYVDPQLKPAPASARALLAEAAAAPSLAAYVGGMGWMNPIYVQLRQAVIQRNYSDERARRQLLLNLERARALPTGKGRHILVNTAQQRLFMYEGGRAVDSMRVVVGKPKYPTPMMAALIRFASLNPYWFVPPDLAAERIAPTAVKRGKAYLDELGYEVLSDWTENATIVDPASVDWQAVADGKVEVRLRQLPGPHNSMGRMKFMFPNEAGIYLHDNPERSLFSEASRLYSGGCVRLEDAPRLGEWLFGKPLVWEGAQTEQMAPLPAPVPVYITYLTAMPEGSSIAYYDDVYGRDAARLATLDARSALASR